MKKRENRTGPSHSSFVFVLFFLVAEQAETAGNRVDDAVKTIAEIRAEKLAKSKLLLNAASATTAPQAAANHNSRSAETERTCLFDRFRC